MTHYNTKKQAVLERLSEFKSKIFYLSDISKTVNLLNLELQVPTSECIAAYITHLEGLHVDFERRYNDLLKMDYPLWFVDQQNHEPGDENFELAEMLLDLKENMKLRRRVAKEGVFAYISIKESYPNIFRHVEASIISFPTTWMVESAFSAVVDNLSKKRNKLDVNSRGTIRLRLNEFIKIDYDILCHKHQYQARH
ncbi:uncharacterized protein LOC115210449 [Octopus sinensis]|uniref:Uncharacterized protein LOC115210449 n=1 Tax=Octopus sinensis TaxID=2607531 RepID=A0A6P7S9Q3_9MOLL|nr:uncharacterized protein LOC115210449 [Octopus sinensis]